MANSHVDEANLASHDGKTKLRFTSHVDWANLASHAGEANS